MSSLHPAGVGRKVTDRRCLLLSYCLEGSEQLCAKEDCLFRYRTSLIYQKTIQSYSHGAMRGTSIMKKSRNPEILFIDGADSRASDRQKVLEDAGFVVMRVHDGTDATESFESAEADVVFVDARVAEKVKSANSHVWVVFICDHGVDPEAWRGDIDVVIDESDFKTKAPWLIGELRSTGTPFFTQWFEAWKSRPSEAVPAERSTRTAITNGSSSSNI